MMKIIHELMVMISRRNDRNARSIRGSEGSAV